MKKMIIGLAVIFVSGVAVPASAQVRVNLNINIGSQPAWGPAGYDYVEYYYLPDIDVYYYVPTRQYIYLNGGNWVFVYTLPPRYGYYNLYSGYKVVINEPRPYLHHHVYKVKYARYKGWYGKQSVNNGNARYKSYKSNNGKGNGHVKAKGRGRGHH
jgi:hypothetical protein